MIDLRDIPDLPGALCAQVGGDDWFPEKGAHANTAKALCRSCPVRDACLEIALSMSPPPEGIWGGLSERDRRNLTARKNREAAA